MLKMNEKYPHLRVLYFGNEDEKNQHLTHIILGTGVIKKPVTLMKNCHNKLSLVYFVNRTSHEDYKSFFGLNSLSLEDN